MAIPDYQALMLPLLRLAADGEDHQIRDADQSLAGYFKLTPQDLSQPLPSGTQPKFLNRVYWAGSFLRHALVLERTGKGTFRITQRGQDLLSTNPSNLSKNDFKNDLMKYPEFAKFAEGKGPVVEDGNGGLQSPLELLESSHQLLMDELAEQVLEQLKQTDPTYFEQIVIELLVRMGYGGSLRDAQAIGRSHDGGIDGVVKQDRLGLDVLYFQAKRWAGTVGAPPGSRVCWCTAGQEGLQGSDDYNVPVLR
jgi:restriction system protein